jgi:hypothetical protein
VMNLLDKLIDHCLDAVMPKVVSHLRNAQTRGVDGIVMTGTWDPTDGTATIAMCDTVFPYTELGDQRILLTKIPIVVDHPSQQVGPVGDEQVVLTRTRSGWIAHMHADLENGKGLGAPAGERFIAHQKVTGTDPLTGRIQTQTDLVVKLTNDGSTPGDGLAAHRVEGGGLHLASTAGGHSDVMDDTTKKSTRKTAGGIFHEMDDALGKATHFVNVETQSIMASVNSEISHIAKQIGLGDLYANLPATANVINKSHLATLGSTIDANRLQDAITGFTQMHAAGVISAGQLATLLIPYVPGFLPGTSIPAGSAVARAKS